MLSNFFNFEKVKISVFGTWRRNFLILFNQKYIKEQLKYRRGECNQCGVCCQIIHPCPHLKNNMCQLHTSKLRRPWECGYAPIDQRDIDDFNKICELNNLSIRCSYYFENQ